MTDLTARIEVLVGRFARERAGEVDGQASALAVAPGSADAGFSEMVERLVSMPLDQYARDGARLEIRVPWCHEALWIVPIDRDAESLGEEGVSRGRIWTARELIALMALPDLTPEIAESVALAKRAVDGKIVEVGPRARR